MGMGWGMCYCQMGGIYKQRKKVATHDSDETSTQMIVYSSRLGDSIFEANDRIFEYLTFEKKSKH